MSATKSDGASQYVSYRVIGRNVRQARERAGLSQEALAERVNLSANHLGCAERGSRRLSINSIALIALTLKMPIEAFFQGSLVGGVEIAVALDKGDEQNAVRFRELLRGCPKEMGDMLIEVCGKIVEFQNK